MKKLLLALLCLVCLSTCPACAEWIDIGVSDDKVKAIYVNTDVADEGLYCTMWLKKIYNTPQRIRDFEYSISLELVGFYFNNDGGNKTVSKNKILRLDVRTYDANEKLLGHSELRLGESENYIAPDSIASYFADWAEILYFKKYGNGK